MSHLDALDAAITRIEQADTALDELAAVVALETVAARIRRELVAAALAYHSAAQVGRALGKSRQAVRQTYGNPERRTGRREAPARPVQESPTTEGTPGVRV